jgi:hypothetical protein
MPFSHRPLHSDLLQTHGIYVYEKKIIPAFQSPENHTFESTLQQELAAHNHSQTDIAYLKVK